MPRKTSPPEGPAAHSLGAAICSPPEREPFQAAPREARRTEPVSSSLELGSEDPCPREEDAGVSREQDFPLHSAAAHAPPERGTFTTASSRVPPYSERRTRRHQSLQHPDPKGSWRLGLRRASKPRAREQKTFEPQDLSPPKSRKTSALRTPESRRAFHSTDLSSQPLLVFRIDPRAGSVS